MQRWVVGTGNRHKISEIREILAPFAIEVDSPSDLGLSLNVVEDGATFAANAALKALRWSQQTGRPAIADDSGIAIDAFGGAPGVISARWAGRDGDDAANNAKLVAELRKLPVPWSTARYHCVIAVAFPRAVYPGSLEGALSATVYDAESAGELVTEGAAIVTRDGTMEGCVVASARGDGGFGYDPYFVLADGRHLAEMSSAEKHGISHRGAALRRLVAWLRAVSQPR